MKMLIGFIVSFFVCSSLAASDLSSIEKKQRKLVTRYYEVLEMMPDRCPQSTRNEYLKSVTEFKKTFPEFISLVTKSKFRLYAVNNFSNRSPISEQACLYIKEALDTYIDTDKGKKSMNKNIEIMRSNG